MSQIELASFQVSRRALPWMLAAVIASLLPHVLQQPPWITALVLFCVGWRWAVHRGRVSYPPRRLQALFALLVLGAVFLHYRTLAGHQAGTSLLLGMYALKLLEMYKERDAYVVILIGYFVAATAFLFHFDLLTAVYVIGVAVLFTATLVAINTSLDVPPLEPLRRAGWLVVQSVPLAIVLFVVIPRIGPLWASGLKPGEATSGVGEEMAMGTVGSLALSDALAFRAEFSGPPPPAARLYWRGLTLSRFDGTTWRQSSFLETDRSLVWYPRQRWTPDWVDRLHNDANAARDAVFEYTIYLEPTQRNLLFALLVPVASERDVALVYDQRLRAAGPVKTLQRYRVRSLPAPARDPEPPDWLLAENLRLPERGNARARAWALQQRAEAGSDAAFIERIRRLFSTGGYVYTLQPPRLGAEPVDGFLFDTRRGFCEHYAGSFVFLARAAGIPARVVAGYQGGERNPLDNTIQVRQYDAHAWAEVWQPGRGWVEVDPTAWVAPDRIERGTQDALGAERAQLGADSLAETLFGSSFGALRDTFDFINHRWNSWVLGFDENAQRGVLLNWLGSLSPYRIGLFVLACGGAVVLVLALWMFRGSLFTRIDPVTREYLRFCAAWAARGHARQPGEGPFDYATRLCAADPQRAREVTRFIALYVRLAYGTGAADGAALRNLRAARVTAA